MMFPDRLLQVPRVKTWVSNERELTAFLTPKISDL